MNKHNLRNWFAFHCFTENSSLREKRKGSLWNEGIVRQPMIVLNANRKKLNMCVGVSGDVRAFDWSIEAFSFPSGSIFLRHFISLKFISARADTKAQGRRRISGWELTLGAAGVLGTVISRGTLLVQTHHNQQFQVTTNVSRRSSWGIDLCMKPLRHFWESHIAKSTNSASFGLPRRLSIFNVRHKKLWVFRVVGVNNESVIWAIWDVFWEKNSMAMGSRVVRHWHCVASLLIKFKRDVTFNRRLKFAVRETFKETGASFEEGFGNIFSSEKLFASFFPPSSLFMRCLACRSSSPNVSGSGSSSKLNFPLKARNDDYDDSEKCSVIMKRAKRFSFCVS